MADRSKWAQLIKRNNVKRVDRFLRSLYVNMDESTAFLQGLIDVAKQSKPDSYAWFLVVQVRAMTQRLPASKLESVLDHLVAIDGFENLLAITLGSLRHEGETSLATVYRLLEIARKQTSYLVADSTTFPSALTAVVVLMKAAAQGATHTWTNALYQSYSAGESRCLCDFITVASRGELSYQVIPYSQTDERYEIFKQEGELLMLALPAPDTLVRWTKGQLDIWFARLISREDGFRRLCDTLRSRFAEYRVAYEDMWLEMMVEPVWGLREGGLDCVRLSMPELRASGHRLIRLQSREPFPNFHATYTIDRLGGGTKQLEIDLEPSDIETVSLGKSREGSILPWADRLLAFMAVRAAWMIVMGLAGRKSDGGWTKNGTSNAGAIVRPRFRRLPEGYHSSSEARARALATFRKEPLPGFTFVKQYERGQAQNSGEPLFAVTDTNP